ncbi:transporter [Bordetella pertussis]|nr:transporter [Bordetella pertussis]
MGATMFILIFYSPLLLQHELDYSPSWITPRARRDCC